MKNTRSLSCVRAQRTMEATKKSKRGEGYVDSGVKILIAVVIGALLLAGLYFLMNNVILPKADEKVTSMFDTSNEVAGTYEIGADVGGGGTGGGGTGGGEMKTITAGTYTFNDTLAMPANTMIENVALTFSGIDAGDTIGTIQVNNTNMVYGVSDDPTVFYIAYHYTGGWSTQYPGQKTVTITSDATVSEAFYNWFTANALLD